MKTNLARVVPQSLRAWAVALTLVLVGLDVRPMKAQPAGITVPTVRVDGVTAALELCPPNADCTGIHFSLRRNGAGLDRTLTVRIQIGGTATPDVDYRKLADTVTFAAGQDAISLYSEPIDDALVEGNETVIVSLMPPTSAADAYQVDPLHASATLIIQDNDTPQTRLEITSPQDGEHFEAGDVIPLSARVIGTDANTTWIVQFLDGDTAIGVVVAGGTLHWQNPSAGTHVVHARAVQSAGIPGVATLVAQPVTITVGPRSTLPVVGIVATRFQTGEPCPVCRVVPGVFRVSRTGPTNTSLTVYLEYDGPATPEVDYHELPRQFVIPAGKEFEDMQVVAKDDLLVEGPETVRASIALPEFATRGYITGAHGNRAMVVIGDDEPGAPAARLDLVQPVEGAQFAEGSIIAITAIGVWTEGEFDRPIDFLANDRLIGTVHPPQFGRPTIPGLPSEHTLLWTNPPPGRHALTARTLLNSDQPTVSPAVQITVGSDPAIPVVRIEATRPIAEETSAPLRRLAFRGEFTITRSGPTNDALAVFVHYSGSATPVADYPAQPFLASIPAGATSTRMEIVPVDDQVTEGIETVVATLSHCPPDTDPALGIPCYLGFHIDPANDRATVFIRDDGITQSSLAITAPKDGGIFPLGSTIPISVTAIDLEGAITHVEFYDGDTRIGESTIFFFVQPPPGTPVYHQFNWTGASLGAHALIARATDAAGLMVQSPTVSIRVIEPPSNVPLVTVMPRDVFAVEPIPDRELNVAAFRVRRTGPTNTTLDVAYSLHGTAANGVDYERLSGQMTIPPGRRSALVTVTPIPDGLPERTETVVLRIEGPLTDQNPPPYQVGTPARAVVLISDRPWIHAGGGADCVRLPEGFAHVCFRAEPPSGYRVEASVNLLSWEPVFHGSPIDGALHFVDDNASQYPRRFYRLAPEPAQPDE